MFHWDGILPKPLLKFHFDCAYGGDHGAAVLISHAACKSLVVVVVTKAVSAVLVEEEDHCH